MTQADDIRSFVIREYIEPARTKGVKEVQVRVGDVNDAMGLHSKQPAIAGALGADKFQSLAGVRLTDRKGPHQGANLVFTFGLL
jgi:hypothetical protein